MDHEGAINHILNRLSTELPKHLTYHGKHHTDDVMQSVVIIGKHHSISKTELNLLRVAAAYHDSGFIYGHESHEAKGCEIAKETLPKFGFTNGQIEEICKMIMATKVPQQPNGTLSDVLCDADLDYLGRDDFEEIAASLFKELKYSGIVENEMQWNRIQIGFLQNHTYHTDFGKEIRQPQKEIHLNRLKDIVSGYDQ